MPNHPRRRHAFHSRCAGAHVRIHNRQIGSSTLCLPWPNRCRRQMALSHAAAVQMSVNAACVRMVKNVRCCSVSWSS